jgi:hypothetical protein
MAPIQPGNTSPDFKAHFFFSLRTGKTILPTTAEMAERVAAEHISSQKNWV